MANPTGTLNADEDHSTRKITNVAHPPVADHDAATKKYVDDSVIGGGSVSDTAFGSSWNGVTTTAPSKNAVYDWAHLIDSDDDGKVNVLDSVAGLIKTDISGVVSNAVAKTDYWDISDFTPSGTSHAHGLVPDPGASAGATKFLREDATWVAPTGTGTVTTTGTPATGNLSKFSGATSITNGDLSGDVTTSGALLTTIANNAISLGKMATVATDSILGRATAATGNVEVLTALPFAFTGDVTRPADSNITTLAAGNAGNLDSGTLLAARMPALTGAVTTSAGTVATTIAAGAVTYAKIQNVSANSKLLGSSATGSGAPPSEITLGTNLSMSGSTLNATGGGGGGTIASTTDILKGDGAGNAVALGSATSGKVLKSNGTVFVPSTETYAAPGTSGNVLTSDGTNWTSAAPSGGAGGGTTSKVSGSNFTTTSVTFVNITGLTFAASANTLYEIDTLLRVQSSDNQGVRVSIQYSAAGATTNILIGGGTGASSAGFSVELTAFGGQSGILATDPGIFKTVWMKGHVGVGANAGNITIQIFKVASGTATVYIGSRMTVTQL